MGDLELSKNGCIVAVQSLCPSAPVNGRPREWPAGASAPGLVGGFQGMHLGYGVRKAPSKDPEPPPIMLARQAERRAGAFLEPHYCSLCTPLSRHLPINTLCSVGLAS